MAALRALRARPALLSFAVIGLAGVVGTSVWQRGDGELRYACEGRMMTVGEIAGHRKITIDDVENLGKQRSLSPDQICTVPQARLNRAIWRLANPKPSNPNEALRWRQLSEQDETGTIAPNGRIDAAMQLASMIERQSQRGVAPASAGLERSNWRWLGPGNIGGRTRSILIHPTDPNKMWLGSVAGGIWRTTNGGTSWAPVNNFLSNMAVSAMAMHPSNPSIMYAGTGEGFYNGDGIRGAGILKSTNGGTTWTQLASTNGTMFQYVNRLAISPDGNTILAATRGGIFRSTDAGATFSLQISFDALDVKFHPTDSTKAVASGYNQSTFNTSVYYSANGGVTWTSATGIPSAYFSRAELAFAPSDGTIVYASVDTGGGKVYKSTNSGQTYALQTSGSPAYLGQQGWYDNVIWVSPTDPNLVVVGGIDLWRSTNGGVSLTKISQWFSAPLSAHADHHVIIHHPGYNGTTNKTVFFGNDGGIYRATDVTTVSLTSGWQHLLNNLGITQFYGAAGNPKTGEVIGGTQDNGTLHYSRAKGPQGWTSPFGGDGGWSAADPTNANYFYGEYVYLQIHRSSNRGVSSSYIYSGISDAGACANFIAPFILDPNDANRMLAGGCSLWRSNNVKAPAPSWASIKPSVGSNISAIVVAPGNADVIYVGHNNGNVYKTTNGTASPPTWTQIDGSLPNRYVTRLTVDWTDSNIVYATFGGYTTPNVYKSVNGGTSWTAIGGSGANVLPAAPVRSLLVSNYNPNWLYVGTEVGIFTSEDGGLNWHVPHDGPTNTSVDELQWMNSALLAATHGRGIWKGETQPCMTLTINISPVANGTVLANPRPNCVTDATKYSRGTKVTLYATPAAGKTFVSWTGAVGTTSIGRVNMIGNRNVTANFSP